MIKPQTIILRILHLEDDENDTLILRRYLLNLYPNVQLHWVSNKEDFIDALAKNTFDIVLADYNVPEFPSYLLQELLKENYPHTMLIFLTGTLADDRLAKETLIDHADGYVLKNNLYKLESLINKFILFQSSAERHTRIQQRLANSQQRIEEAKKKYFET